MIPTLLVGDHLLVNKFIYRFKEPARGDVIVFKYPDDPSRNFIKRVIGVGGDTIEVRDKVLYVNGTAQTRITSYNVCYTKLLRSCHNGHVNFIVRHEFIKSPNDIRNARGKRAVGALGR